MILPERRIFLQLESLHWKPTGDDCLFSVRIISPHVSRLGVRRWFLKPNPAPERASRFSHRRHPDRRQPKEVENLGFRDGIKKEQAQDAELLKKEGEKRVSR